MVRTSHFRLTPPNGGSRSPASKCASGAGARPATSNRRSTWPSRRSDPGISRLHAMLIAAPDGTWSVLDPGSANGTLLNGRKIAIGDLVTLHEGDRINLGAWTVITVHRG